MNTVAPIGVTTPPSILDQHAEFIGKLIEKFNSQGDIDGLYCVLVTASTTRQIFVDVYEFLVSSGQMESIEKLSYEEKKYYWEIALEKTKGLSGKLISTVNRTQISKSVYLIQTALK